MSKIYKYGFTREGRAKSRTLVFIGQHEPEIEAGLPWVESVEIEIEGETTAFVLALTREEAKRIRGFLDLLGI